MSEQLSVGCKKCGGVVEIEVKASSYEISIRRGDNTEFRQKRSGVEIRCKKCHKAVAELGYLELTD